MTKLDLLSIRCYPPLFHPYWTIADFKSYLVLLHREHYVKLQLRYMAGQHGMRVSCECEGCHFQMIIRRKLKGKQRKTMGAYLVEYIRVHSRACPFRKKQYEIYFGDVQTQANSIWLREASWSFKKEETFPKLGRRPRKKALNQHLTPYQRGKLMFITMLVDPPKEGGPGWAMYQRYVHFREFVKSERGRAWCREQAKVYQDILDFREWLKREHSLLSPRDQWMKALPEQGDKHYEHRDFMCFFLLILSAGIGDNILCPYLKKVFEEYPVSAQWVLEIGQDKLAEILTPLSRQYVMAGYITNVARDIINHHNGCIPKKLKTHLLWKGVGAKIGILTIYHVHSINLGVPVDRHLFRVFKSLDWCYGATAADECSLHVKMMMPPTLWPGMNDCLAGLCQLLRIDESRTLILSNLSNRICKAAVHKIKNVTLKNKIND